MDYLRGGYDRVTSKRDIALRKISHNHNFAQLKHAFFLFNKNQCILFKLLLDKYANTSYNRDVDKVGGGSHPLYL